MIRRIARVLSRPIVWALMPVKVFAFRRRPGVVKRAILEVTSFADWMLVFANVQNPAMLIHFRAYGGNFLFGKAVMIVDAEVTERAIAAPAMRGNRFMGVDLVSNDPGAFATNAGPITMGQPTRGLARGYIDDVVMGDRLRTMSADAFAAECEEILAEWKTDPAMATWSSIRGAVTRAFIRVMTGKTLPKAEVDAIAVEYAKCFTEFSLLGRYAPFLMGLVGTRERVRADVFLPLRRHGLDNMTIDMALFAAMFSVGTIVLKCCELLREHAIDYPALDRHRKMQFVIEAQRVYPTVTSVHRIVEEEEEVEVRGRKVTLHPGEEVAYPFVCANLDPSRFSEPERFRLDRPPEEVARVLSWSAGPHVCPARDLSIVATVVLLEALAAKHDLRTKRIFNPEF
jgi:hypothetical protein